MILCPDKIITGDGRTVLEGYAVRIGTQGTITDVEKRDVLCARHPGEETAVYQNATLLPGLCDAHVHTGYLPGDVPRGNRDDMLLSYFVLRKLQMALQKGITLIRDVASPEPLGKAIRYADEHGYIQVPRMVACGAGLCITGGHFNFAYPGVVEVDGVQEVVRAVRQRFKDGYCWVKLMTTDQTEAAEFSQEELNAAAAETHRLGGKITVHATNRLGIQMCIDAGVDGIEHSCEMTEQQAELMARQGIAWTPTILVYRRSFEREKHSERPDMLRMARYERACNAYRDSFLRYYRMGMPVVAGTDINDMPLAEELACMVELGLSPVEAIRVGTHNGASLLGLGETTGLIREGLSADLLIVRGDAQQDIAVLQQPLAVFLKGKSVM